MLRQLKVACTAVMGLLAATCAEGREARMAAPQSSAIRQADIDGPNESRSTAAEFDATVPVAYYQLSLGFARRTGGFTPPVQSRAFGYMGLALYEALVAGMPDHRSIARQLRGVGSLPQAKGIPYNWALVASAALAEVMRGLWGDKTDHAAHHLR
ncbi:MAG TPA: hypothetical protein VJN70_12285, partial [Gemmatimonadaceae bacterium]|nr:hypothetical protein [Gemmatimonadaceae bacterium]